MKKLILITILATFLSQVHAQSEKFTGIGIFKIGSDTSVLYNYARDNKVKFSTEWRDDKVLKKLASETGKSEIIKLVDSFKPSNRIDVSKCPDAKDFYVGMYEVGGIKIYNIRLVYYKNELVSFSSSSTPALREALRTKYGEPEVTQKTNKTGSCAYNNYSENFYATWLNGDIKAVEQMDSYYNINCEKTVLKIFYYTRKDENFRQCEIDGLNKPAIDPNAEKKKAALKDF